VITDFKTATKRQYKQVISDGDSCGAVIYYQFSPLSNVRTDNYGGSLKTRIRLTLEVVEAVQQKMAIKLTLICTNI
jgi:hypothetical protein